MKKNDNYKAMQLRILLTLIVLTIFLGACSKKRSFPTSGEAILTLSGNTDISVTRAITDLAPLTKVGVYVLQTGTSATTMETTPFKNALYTATGSGGAFISTAAYVLEIAQTYNVRAYSPRLETTPADASILSFAHGTDLLFAPSIAVSIVGTNARAALSFEHKMAQIKFALISGAGSPSINGAVMKVTGFDSSCTLNLNDGTVTPVTGPGEVVTQYGQAISIVPGLAPKTLHVSLTTTDSRIYSGTISTTVEASKSYTYSLTVNKNDVLMEISCKIVDWTTINGGSVKVEG